MMIPEMCSRPRSVTTFDGWLIFRAHLNHQPLKRVNLNYLYKQISPNKIDNYFQDGYLHNFQIFRSVYLFGGLPSCKIRLYKHM